MGTSQALMDAAVVVCWRELRRREQWERTIVVMKLSRMRVTNSEREHKEVRYFFSVMAKKNIPPL